MPNFSSSVPALKFSITMSERAASLRMSAWPSGLCMSIPTWYLEWFMPKKATETFFQKKEALPRIRVTSPCPGISTLITSAPSSPRKSAVAGPKMMTERSSTRIPWSASGFSWIRAGSNSWAAHLK